MHKNAFSLLFLCSGLVAAACVTAAELEPQSREPSLGPRAVQDDFAARRYSKEIVDTGDEPLKAGCVRYYDFADTTCAGRIVAHAEESCITETELAEYVNTRACANDHGSLKFYDCREVMGNPAARCVVKPDVCPDPTSDGGRRLPSAQCEIPTTVAVCKCPRDSSDPAYSIITDDCAGTALAMCPNKTCVAEVNRGGQITRETLPCETVDVPVADAGPDAARDAAAKPEVRLEGPKVPLAP